MASNDHRHQSDHFPEAGETTGQSGSVEITTSNLASPMVMIMVSNDDQSDPVALPMITFGQPVSILTEQHGSVGIILPELPGRKRVRRSAASDAVGHTSAPDQGAPSIQPENIRTDGGGGDEPCAICLQPFSPYTNRPHSMTLWAKCGHSFGRDCVDKARAQNGDRCPICMEKAEDDRDTEAKLQIRFPISPQYDDQIDYEMTRERNQVLEDEMKDLTDFCKIQIRHLNLQYLKNERGSAKTREKLMEVQSQLAIMKRKLRPAAARQDGVSGSQLSRVTYFTNFNGERGKLEGGCSGQNADTLYLSRFVPKSDTHFKYGVTKFSMEVGKPVAGLFRLHEAKIHDMSHSIETLEEVMTVSADGFFRICDFRVPPDRIARPQQQFEFPFGLTSVCTNEQNTSWKLIGTELGEIVAVDVRYPGTHIIVPLDECTNIEEPVSHLSYIRKGGDLHRSGFLVQQKGGLTFLRGYAGLRNANVIRLEHGSPPSAAIESTCYDPVSRNVAVTASGSHCISQLEGGGETRKDSSHGIDNNHEQTEEEDEENHTGRMNCCNLQFSNTNLRVEIPGPASNEFLEDGRRPTTLWSSAWNDLAIASAISSSIVQVWKKEESSTMEEWQTLEFDSKVKKLIGGVHLEEGVFTLTGIAEEGVSYFKSD